MRRPPRITYGASLAPPLTAIADEARIAAEHGVTELWWPDHLIGFFPTACWDAEFGVDTSYPAPDALIDPFIAAGVASVTAKFERLGLSVSDPFRRHPAVLLQSAATIAAGGVHFALGIGAGAPANLQPFGIPVKGRLEAFAKAVEHIKQLRDHDGPVWHGEGAFALAGGLSAIPQRKNVSVWIGGGGDWFLELTGREGEGWLPSRLSGADYARQFSVVRDAASHAGHPPPVAGMFCWAIVCADHEAAHRLMEAPILRTLILFRLPSYFQQRGIEHPLSGIVDSKRYLPSNLTLEQARTAIERTPFNLIHDWIVHGSPDEVVAWAGEMGRHGLEHVVLWDITRYLTGGRAASRLLDVFEIQG